MNIQVTGRHVELTEPLKQYAESKIGKLGKYFDTAIDAHIVLSVEKHRHRADVNILVNGLNISADSVTHDLYASIDTVLDKVERQVRRYKEKIKNHQPRQSQQDTGYSMNIIDADAFDGAEESEVADKKPEIIKSGSFKIKPMNIDEAAMQMNLINNDFLVFRNAETDQVNVIYVRKDGNYGLVEPENV